VHKGNGAPSFAVLRHCAHNLLQQEVTRQVTVEAKRLRAGGDHDYLVRVLASQVRLT